jgi:hypothetical protein
MSSLWSKLYSCAAVTTQYEPPFTGTSVPGNPVGVDVVVVAFPPPQAATTTSKSASNNTAMRLIKPLLISLLRYKRYYTTC